MKLIIGLGNPGDKYKNTWHNLGFLTLDKLHQKLGLPAFKLDKKMRAEISEGKIGREKIILAKPQTYMNNSGEAVSLLAHHYKIKTADLAIIHDDIDLPLGKIRTKTDSSSGGHNGIKSIIEALGSQEFYRLKIGVKTELIERLGASDYVLTQINKEQREIVQKNIEAAMNTLISDLGITIDS